MKQKPRKKTTRAQQGHAPRSRTMLLPMPAAAARACQLENHLALVALSAAQGNLHVLGRLLKMVYLANFLRPRHTRCPVTHTELSLAEHALKSCLARASDDGAYWLTNEEHALVAVVLAVHDDQLAKLPLYVIEEARAKTVLFSQMQAAAMFAFADGLYEDIVSQSALPGTADQSGQHVDRTGPALNVPLLRAA